MYGGILATMSINTLRPKHLNGIQISPMFASKISIDNKLALILEKAWCGIDDKPLVERKFYQLTDVYIRQQASKFNLSPPGQNGRHFANDIFRCIFVSVNVGILIKISLKFLPKGPIDNNSTLVQIMSWCRIGDKPLSEPMLTRLTEFWKIAPSVIRHCSETSQLPLKNPAIIQNQHIWIIVCVSELLASSHHRPFVFPWHKEIKDDLFVFTVYGGYRLSVEYWCLDRVALKLRIVEIFGWPCWELMKRFIKQRPPYWGGECP